MKNLKVGNQRSESHTEATKDELEMLYNRITEMGMEELKTYEDNFPSTITVILPGKILIPLPIGPEEQNLRILATILKNESASAVITIAKGWAVRPNGDEPISLSLNRHPESEEIFFAGIESVEVMKTKMWKIERDEKGKMIFPLGRPEVFWDDEAFALKFTGTTSILTRTRS